MSVEVFPASTGLAGVSGLTSSVGLAGVRGFTSSAGLIDSEIGIGLPALSTIF